MIYTIDFTDDALADIKKLTKSGDKIALRKFKGLIVELKNHPTTGTGKPERLKYYASETWSREISKKHRLVYEIRDQTVEVLILSAYGHYDDK